MKARIIGLGSYLPERILSNFDLEKMVDTSDEWIRSRTGMSERRIAAPDEASSDMGFKAAEKALKDAQISADQLDLVIVATMSPDYLTPSTAALVQAKLGASQAGAFDIQAACSGYLYGLSSAKAFIESGMYQNVLVIASEKMSAFIDYEDRNTCVLFGDGAAAAVVSNKGEGLAISSITLGADGGLGDLIIIPGGGSRQPVDEVSLGARAHFVKMSGKEVFKHAVRRMTHAAKVSIETAGMQDSEISWIVPHQANQRIIDSITKNFGVPDEKVWKVVHKYGNTSGSSVGITLDELMRAKTVNVDEKLLLVAFGAGLTWGASILTKVKE